ncbi:MAG: hypothetical protein PF448_13110 [Bacteroidales bacterium]|jgi:hypothetical protein|nr:hypothetical protein [Bacteroidales bacterium]
MIVTDPVVELLKYFCKFPNRDGVLKNFARSSEKVNGYNDLKTYIQELPAAIMPEIKDFIFTSDSDVLKDRVRTASDYFMLLEYGQIVQSGQNKMKVRETEWLVSLTIAHQANGRNHDGFEEALLSNQALNIVRDLIQRIDADDSNTCASGRLLDKPISISPVEPYLLYNSYGWVLTFKKTATNLSF